MLNARRKLTKDDPTPLEDEVAKAIYDLQQNSEKLKQPLREVQVCSAKEIELSSGKKAVAVFVPVPQLALYQKMIADRSLIDELEKKMGGRSVVIIAQRRIIRKENRQSRQLKQKRPFSRTLTAVHDSMLADVVYPSEITGKRIRFRPDGSRIQKIFLSKPGATSDKVEMFTTVYKQLTGKDVVFN
eukprot:m.15523 g.15523  ORF g.15523 m.15523 type:complete len:186 (-) comp6642_c0_seq1:1585-2142(-)